MDIEINYSSETPRRDSTSPIRAKREIKNQSPPRRSSKKSRSRSRSRDKEKRDLEVLKLKVKLDDALMEADTYKKSLKSAQKECDLAKFALDEVKNGSNEITRIPADAIAWVGLVQSCRYSASKDQFAWFSHIKLHEKVRSMKNVVPVNVIGIFDGMGSGSNGPYPLKRLFLRSQVPSSSSKFIDEDDSAPAKKDDAKFVHVMFQLEFEFVKDSNEFILVSKGWPQIPFISEWTETLLYCINKLHRKQDLFKYLSKETMLYQKTKALEVKKEI